jgi:hypothetical protein
MKATLPSTPLMHILPGMERVIVLDGKRFRGKRLLRPNGLPETYPRVKVTDPLGTPYKPEEIVECDQYTPTYALDEDITRSMNALGIPQGSYVLFTDGTIAYVRSRRGGWAVEVIHLDGKDGTNWMSLAGQKRVIDLSRTHLIIEP